MLASFATMASKGPQVNWSWGNGLGRPNTLRTRLKTSRTRLLPRKISRTMLWTRVSESPGRSSQLRAALK
eukprot:13705072-Alexandrium_andersonii.AAC.1